jgi:hypothetical protein
MCSCTVNSLFYRAEIEFLEKQLKVVIYIVMMGLVALNQD